MVERFGSRFVPYRWLGIPAEIATRPFLKDWVAPPTVETALASEAPLFVSAHVDDTVLSLGEIDALRTLAGKGECVLCEPHRKEYENAPWPVLLDGHFDLSIQALRISREEIAFLQELFPSLPPMEQRVEELLAKAGDPEAARLLQRDDVRERLGAVLTQLLHPNPAAAVAAAVHLTEDEIMGLRHWGCLKWLVSPVRSVQVQGPAPPPTSLDELLDVFDLGADPVRRKLILRGLDRARSASLANVRFGDGHWWTSGADLRAMPALAAVGCDRPEFLDVISTSLTLMELDMGLMLGEARLSSEERHDVLMETLLRAAWFAPNVRMGVPARITPAYSPP